ncbi:hypothetical protein KSZ_66270 [Dictyobacter formicarum]|uniref:Nitroreductase n=1 Tax=Dictyobacter formicarum TaxID=2778368 RepID=A0ABQ3VU37_9CHLR|nr:hypothetical protein KSZ_66270 [Dictyobacter formicarum]
MVGIRLVLMLAVLVAIARSNRERLLNRLRTFNKHYMNPRVLKIAGRHNSPYAALQHVGRRSESIYTTPVLADFVPRLGGFVIPLPYGENTDWCRNVMASGHFTLTRDQVVYTLIEPTLIDAADVLPELPAPMQGMWRSLGLKKFLKVRIEHIAKVEKPVERVSANGW